LLGEVTVGRLSEDASKRVSFQFLEEHRNQPSRSVLGQCFEKDLWRIYMGRRKELPAFFSNLLPEEPMRGIIEGALEVPPDDDLSLRSGWT
jgi:HipA-like protein